MKTYLSIQEIIDKVSLNTRSSLKKHQHKGAIKNDLELIDLELQAHSENNCKKHRRFQNTIDVNIQK